MQPSSGAAPPKAAPSGDPIAAGPAAVTTKGGASHPASRTRKAVRDESAEQFDTLYRYKEEGRQPIPLQPWKQTDEDEVLQPTAAERAAFGALVQRVRDNVGINKPCVDPLHQIWFRELMKRAAGFTSWAAVNVINNRQPIELQTRPYVEDRVEELVRNFDHTLLGTAVVIVQDVLEEEPCDWDKDTVSAACEIRRAWQGGKAHDLLAAIEDVAGAPEVHAYTVVGNHSTEACSKAGVQRREAYIFFRSALTDDDFRFLSRTDNELARAGASTTALYDEYKRPLRLVPFLRALWERHGRPQFKGRGQQRYLDYTRNVNVVLEHEPATSNQGQSVAPWLEDDDRQRDAERLKAILETKLKLADTHKGEKRLEELQAVSPISSCRLRVQHI